MLEHDTLRGWREKLRNSIPGWELLSYTVVDPDRVVGPDDSIDIIFTFVSLDDEARFRNELVRVSVPSLVITHIPQ